MGTFVHVVADDAVLERIADTPAGTLAKTRAVRFSFEPHDFSLPDEEYLARANDEEGAIAAIHPNAHALDNLADDQGLRGFMGAAVVHAKGLESGCGETSEPELMVQLLELQRANLFSRTIGSNQREVDEANRAHIARCNRAIDEVRAGNVKEIAWY